MYIRAIVIYDCRLCKNMYVRAPKHSVKIKFGKSVSL